MNFYSGRATALLDDKSRLTIPRRYRKFMQPNQDEVASVWLIPGDGECDFKIMDKETGNRWANALTNASVPGAGAGVVRRLLGMADLVEIDKAGRVLLTKEFMEDNRVTGEREFGIAGRGDCLQVYGAAKWALYLEQVGKPDVRETAWKLLADVSLPGLPARG